METWVTIKNYEGLYEVSDLGRVRSLTHLRDSGLKGILKTTCRGRVLIDCINGKGYPIVTLLNEGVRRNHNIHRLVAEAFILNPESKPQINHKNGIKPDCWRGNLEWVTSSENAIHAYKTGLTKGPIGELQGNSKLKTVQVIEMRELYNSGISQKELALTYNTSNRNISLIVNRKRWKHV